MKGVDGVRKFLDRAWRLIIEDRADDLQLSSSVTDEPATEEQLRVLHKTIKAVTHDLDTMSFNTAIARLMEFVNYFTKESKRSRDILEPFVLLISPMAPHLAEELWALLGHQQTLSYEPWPTFDEALTLDATIEVPVQILGKVRGKIVVPADADQQLIEQTAKSDERIAALLEGKQIVKTIVVPGRLVNFVTRGA
jgi:leucyl-tRNA synthetase